MQEVLNVEVVVYLMVGVAEAVVVVNMPTLLKGSREHVISMSDLHYIPEETFSLSFFFFMSTG